VWFNSMQREEPYPGLTCRWYPRETEGTREGACTGAARLSSARAVRCWVKSRNERNPRRQLPRLAGPPGPTRRKVGTTSSQHGPYVRGDTHATMAGTMGREGATRSQSQQTRPQFGSEAATRLREVGVASNRRSAHGGECVPGPCTHRPSRHESRGRLKPAGQPFGGAAVEGGTGDRDEVVTR
jgi:hypothetical protein